MFPKPIEKQPRAAQITYQAMLPVALAAVAWPSAGGRLVLGQTRCGFYQCELLGHAVEL